MKIKNLVRISVNILYFLVIIFPFALAIFTNIKTKPGWIPGLIIRFLDYAGQNALMSLMVFLGLLFMLSVSRDLPKDQNELVSAENLNSAYFYRIEGNVKEVGDSVLAICDVFVNISGTGPTYRKLVKVKKEYFPFFMLNEKRKDRLIFSGTYLKVDWTAK